MESVFEAFISNPALYSAGHLVGETLHFPTNTEEVQSLLKRIGVDGVRCQEYFIISFDSDILGLYDYLGEYENIDELNHLAHLLKELSPSERETLEAVMDSGQHCGSVQDLINLTQNLDCYDLHPGVDNEEMLGRLYVEDMEKQDARSTSSVSYCMGTFYLSDWSNSGDTLADFSAVDAIGLLDGAPFDGGIYDTTAAELAEAILAGYSYTLDESLAAERVQGYIAAGTRREALQQLAFAIGAVVDCSRGELIRIAPAPSKASGMITYDRKLQDGSKVTLNPLITAVAVTAHRYLPGESTEELYRDTLDPGTYRVTFNAPAVVGSLTVTGAELTESGVNLCTLTVAEAGEVCVTGRKYADSTVVLKRTAANLPPNAQDNELTVTDATLVDPSRAEAVAVRVLEHYAQRYEQNFSMVAGDEKLADRLIIQSFGGEMVRGMLTKLEFDLTGGFLADAKVIGRRLTSNAAAYAGEIHAGERNLI